MSDKQRVTVFLDKQAARNLKLMAVMYDMTISEYVTKMVDLDFKITNGKFSEQKTIDKNNGK